MEKLTYFSHLRCFVWYVPDELKSSDCVQKGWFRGLWDLFKGALVELLFCFVHCCALSVVLCCAPASFFAAAQRRSLLRPSVVLCCASRIYGMVD